MSDWGASLRLPTRVTRAAIRRGMKDGAELILAGAQDKAPVLSGDLRDSGTTAVEGTTAAVGFTDSKAIAAHENLTAHLRNGKQPKFLELALHENSEAALELIAAQIREALS